VNNPSNETPDRGPFERQVHVPRRLLLATFSGAPGAGGATRFRLDVPDSRVHWRIDVIASETNSAPGSVVLSGKNCTIWAAATVEDQGRGGDVPVVDIEGTEAAPTVFPVSTGLGGISIENPGTACDGVQVEIVIPAVGGGPAGSLFAQARIQPNVGHFFQPGEWEQIKAACSLTPIEGVIRT
jgi:hypothetical protein